MRVLREYKRQRNVTVNFKRNSADYGVNYSNFIPLIFLPEGVSSCKPGTFSSILAAVYQFYSCYHLAANRGNLL